MDISGVVYADTKSVYEVDYKYDIVYAHRPTGELRLQLLCPIPHGEGDGPFPLVVDVPGSGWAGADGHRHVPALVKLAQNGFAAAGISYRGTFKDDVRFPAAVQDLMEAVRFLRAHAAEYNIDPDRVAMLGDSSGGHTVAIGAMAGARDRFNIGENLDARRDVKACVIFYGPNDMQNLVADRLAEGKKLRPGEGELPFEAHEIWQDDYKADPAAYMADCSAINYIPAEGPMPPVLFLQGDDDPIIPVRQGVRFCERVRAAGGRAEFFKIAGGSHGKGCWTPEVMELVVRFLNAYVK